MKITVEQVLLREQTVTGTLPNFDSLFEEFKTCNREMERLIVVQESNTKGFTIVKNNNRKVLEHLTGNASRKLVAYYSSQQDYASVARVRFTDTKIKIASDSKLVTMADQLLGFVEKDLAHLGPYHLGAKEKEAFISSKERFKEVMNIPTLRRSDKANATSQLVLAFKKSDELLKNLDVLVSIVKSEQTTFFYTYTSSRKINDLGGRSLSLKAKAKDSEGNPLPNVVFDILPVEETIGSEADVLIDLHARKPILSKKTSAKGGMQIRKLPDGTYKALVKKHGFLEKEVRFYVVGGELVRLHVTLEEDS